ncbi:MAG: glutamate--tRNA ligase [Anaerolineales bacterium]|nr:glutamate--tRNA ligase [Anaerolineales bacterium]
MNSKPIRVRFAPSPTGRMHLGSARTALYDYLLARRTGGTFILRIEDTDTKRTVPGSERELMAGLRWLGLDYDEGPDVGGSCGPYRQSERREIYQSHAWELVEKGAAFPCFCAAERLEKVRQERQKQKLNTGYDGFCRNLDPDEARRRAVNGERHVIRFMSPRAGVTNAVDLLRGPIVVPNEMIDDYVLLKSDGLPTYHLAAMVDDHLMGISHVIRGAEWLSTFPLHALIVRAFGWEEPVWMHLSVFLKPSGKGKMSKRDTALAMDSGYSIYIGDLEKLGYIPEGVLNWIALMGWGVSEDDVMTLAQMVERFDISHLNPAPAAINFSKLDHFSGTHIRLLPDEEIARRIKPYFIHAGLEVDNDTLLKIIPLIRERLVTLDDCLPFAAWFFKGTVEPKPEELIAKNLTAAQCAEIARKSYDILASLPEITLAQAEPAMRALVETLGLSAGQIFGILRVAITGQTVSPPLFESMEIVGKEKVLERVRGAMGMLEKMR